MANEHGEPDQTSARVTAAPGPKAGANPVERDSSTGFPIRTDAEKVAVLRAALELLRASAERLIRGYYDTNLSLDGGMRELSVHADDAQTILEETEK